MVGNYVRKSNREAYSKENLTNALNEVQTSTLSIYRASKIYNIPKTTMRDHLKGRRGKKSSTLGRPTALPSNVDNKIVEDLTYMEKHGFGLLREEVLLFVGEYVHANNLETPFVNGVPSQERFILFKKRLNLSLKKPESVEYSRKKATDPFIVSEYFKILEETITTLDLENKPDRIWNLCETSFCIDPSKTTVVGVKWQPSTKTTNSSGRDNISVLMACNAAGGKAPPLIIFRAKHMWDQWQAPEDSGLPEPSYACTDNGWMQSDVFAKCFERVFLKRIGDARPILLIFDGHSTDSSQSQYPRTGQKRTSWNNQVAPHSSHLQQPLDLSVFKPLTTYWDQALVKWQRQLIGRGHFML